MEAGQKVYFFLEQFEYQKLFSSWMKRPTYYWHCTWSLISTNGRFHVNILIFLLHITVVLASTNSQDAAAISALANQWQNKPLNWIGNDPCDGWVGISCSNSRIVSITLSSLGIKETLPGDIQFVDELQSLDLSYNPGLKGSLPPSIGKLRKLVNLVLIGCSFSGEIPPEIGLLESLVFLSLNSNSFTGSIPATIGNLSNLYWLDLADNKLTGTIPVSNGSLPGLDMLTHTKHFHFGINHLSGTIPSKLFSSQMALIHLLLDGNNLEGGIPLTLGQVKSLEVIRLDGNSLTGPIPTNLNSLTSVVELHLSNNKLMGPLPNLTGMNVLSYLDMSNNSFDPSDAPPWFSTLPSLTTLILENLGIGGELPQALFTISSLQTVRLRNNRFNGTLDLGTDYSNDLELVDLQNNRVDQFTFGGGYNKTLILVGNPVCNQSGMALSFCRISQESFKYSTPIHNCQVKACPTMQDFSPNCDCAYPFTGTLYFRAPSFSDLKNTTIYGILESKLESSFQEQQLPVDSVALHNPFFDSKTYLEMALQVFPSGDIRFKQSDLTHIAFTLSNQTFKPPKMFGPYYFLAQQYDHFLVDSTNKKQNKGPLIIGVAAGLAVLALVFVIIAVLLIRGRKKPKKNEEQSRSYGSTDLLGNSGSAPQLKGARWFSFDELKKCTNGFSHANEIGNGGYGKVYRGMLSNGQYVAVKRAHQEALHRGLEFKNEIELLSRFHHRNLVSLVGFCFDQDEQMLVYEYIPNGSLKDSLSGQSGIHLDWKRRLRIALGSAKGLSYLHELANPPIVHRDVKSSNILLDDQLNAKVSDFGLSKPLGDDKKRHVTTQVKGTMGYLDPEYYMTQQLTEKSDVYSFGVLLLEIITGKKPIERGRYVVREVKLAVDKTKDLYGLHELLDPALGLGTILGLENFVDLALHCVEELGEDRPTMGDVVKELENIMHLAGINPTESASTSLSYEGASRIHHPYRNEPFDYSGGPPSSKLEPK